MEQHLDHHRRDGARGNGEPRPPRHFVPAVRRPGLPEKRHQRADDEDGLEALAHQQQQRLHQQVGAGPPIRHDPLGALQVREQRAVQRLELRGRRAGGHARLQPPELVLEA